MTPPRMYVEGQNETKSMWRKRERERVNAIVERNDDQHRDRLILYVNKEKKREAKRTLLVSL